MAANLDVDTEDFSNSESLGRPNTSHQVWAQSDLAFISRFSRQPLWRPSWILEQNEFSNSESLYRSDASHQVWAHSNLPVWELFEEFQNGCYGGHLGYLNGII